MDNFIFLNDLKYEIYVFDKLNFIFLLMDKYVEVIGIVSINILGLLFDIIYYFVIKVEDVIGNGSFLNKLFVKIMVVVFVFLIINMVVEVNDVMVIIDILIYDVE